MLTSQATDVASQASATGIILTCDAILGESKPMAEDVQARAPCVSESSEMKKNIQIDFENRMMRHAIKCWIGTAALLLCCCTFRIRIK